MTKTREWLKFYAAQLAPLECWNLGDEDEHVGKKRTLAFPRIRTRLVNMDVNKQKMGFKELLNIAGGAGPRMQSGYGS